MVNFTSINCKTIIQVTMRLFQPSVAPVSRNYNEMRDRLRQLLTKKKAKKCKNACSPTASPVEVTQSKLVAKPKANFHNSDQKASAQPQSLAQVANNIERNKEKDIDVLLEFIEGNQAGKKDDKKAEKKAKQKQRKVQ